jgi:hypothetical protein
MDHRSANWGQNTRGIPFRSDKAPYFDLWWCFQELEKAVNWLCRLPAPNGVQVKSRQYRSQLRYSSRYTAAWLSPVRVYAR